jgi:hypothetical protein
MLLINYYIVISVLVILINVADILFIKDPSPSRPRPEPRFHSTINHEGDLFLACSIDLPLFL